MLGMLKRHEVEVLLKAGHSQAEVARLTEVGLRSVQRLAKEVPVVHVDDAAERKQRRIGRPNVVENFRKQVATILEQEPDLPSLEILRRVRETGYEGGKTALYGLVASIRPQTSKPLVRFEGLPGEFSQHDFGQVDAKFLDGPINRPKTIAVEWEKNGKVTKWNSVFACATLEIGIGVELCWPYQPRQKGSVENLVGFVKSSFFKVRKFYDEEDLRQQLVEWHHEVNEERPCRANGIIPAARLAEEAPRLRPLKVRPEELALRIPIYVGPTGTVLYEGHAYSMPPEAISMPATLYLYADRVRIVAGRYKAEHPRKFVPQESSWLAEHRAALVASVSGKRGKRYLKRQQLLELGEPAIRYLTELVHRRPRGWWVDVDRLHNLLQSHGPEVLGEAMEEGLNEQRFDVSFVEEFLQGKLNFSEEVST